MAKNPLIRSYPKKVNAPLQKKSAGILDDAPVRKTIATRQGTITQTPTEHFDIVNKNYVDDSIPASVSLFLTENASDLGGVYLDMEVDPVTAGEENTLTAIPANSTGTLMASFATPLNDSVIDGIVELPIGVYNFHIHCQASSATKLSMYAELYHRNAGGTETLLLTTEDSDLIPIIKGSIGFHGTLATEKDWIAGDRIVIKLYGKNNSASSRNLTIYVEGNTASRAELPAIRGSSVAGGAGDVTAGANLTDEKIVQGDGGAKGVKTSTASVSDIHSKQHAINSATDHTSPLNPGQMIMANVITGLPNNATNTNVEVAGAVNHSTGDGSDHADVATNSTHVAGDGSDHADVAANTLKDTNVTTNITVVEAPTNVDIQSSDGSNDTIAAADVTNAGVMTTTMYDEHVVNTAHAIDNTQAHTDYLLNSAADVGVGLSLTGDNASADTTYVPNVLYNTDATPPTASTVPIGTIYVQYTA